MLNKIRNLLLSPYYTLFLFFISAIAYVLGDNAIIACLFVEVQLVAIALCLSDDFAPTLLPILNILVIGMTMLERFHVLLPWLPATLTIIPAFIFHLTVYRKHIRVGISFYGLLATAGAILLSGLFNRSNANYADPFAMYYLLGMSIGLVAFYCFVASDVKRPKNYDQMHYFLHCLCYVGALCAFVVLVNFSKWIFFTGERIEVQDYFSLMPQRNTLANLLILCLPAAFYYAGYILKHHVSKIALFLVGCVFYGAMLLTAARTAMIFGTVILICCLVYYLNGNGSWRFKISSVLIVSCGIALVAYYLYEPIQLLFSSRLDEGLASLTETRWELLLRSFSDFAEHPIFGIGFISSQNSDLYAADGCISWYHLYFPQIWGSLGLVGCVAFFYQLYTRFRLAIFQPNYTTVAIVLSYLGLFLYSQTDPGEFVPIPFAVLAVLMFVFLEHRYEERTYKAPRRARWRRS